MLYSVSEFRKRYLLLFPAQFTERLPGLENEKKQKNKTSNVLFLITVHILNDVGISG